MHSSRIGSTGAQGAKTCTFYQTSCYICIIQDISQLICTNALLQNWKHWCSRCKDMHILPNILLKNRSSRRGRRTSSTLRNSLLSWMAYCALYGTCQSASTMNSEGVKFWEKSESYAHLENSPTRYSMYMYMYIYVHRCAHTYAYLYVYMCVWEHVCACVCVFVHVNVCIYVHVYVYSHVYACVCAPIMPCTH